MDIFTWRPLNNRAMAKCGIEVYQKGQLSVVIATELADNPGMSICNGFEDLISQIAIAYQLTTQLITWVEYWEKDNELNLVRFNANGDRVSNPSWVNLPPALFSKASMLQQLKAHGYKANNNRNKFPSITSSKS